MEKKLICSDCNMVFRSARLLEKHKALFCIGRAGGDLRVQRRSSDIVMRNKGEGIDPKQMRTPDLVQVSKSAWLLETIQTINLIREEKLNYLLYIWKDFFKCDFKLLWLCRLTCIRQLLKYELANLPYKNCSCWAGFLPCWQVRKGW